MRLVSKMRMSQHFIPDEPTSDTSVTHQTMKTPIKLLIVTALAVAVIAALALKKNKAATETEAAAPLAAAQSFAANDAPSAPAAAAPSAGSVTTTAAPLARAKLPKLIDLGADKCIPCKMMAPLLEELKREYAGRLEVEFIDVWKNPDAGQRYGIQMIPTQIFYDADGKERSRHVGFIGKEDILAKWKELGVELR
jgi:thioredoxin 1